MKRILLLFLLTIIIIVKSFSQNYQLNFTGSGVSSSIDSIHVLNLTQNTSVSLMGNDILHLLATVGIQKTNNTEANISIYPNPFTEKTFIDFAHTKEGEINIQVMDMNGKKIFGFSKYLNLGVHVFELSGLKSGIYNLIIEGASGKYYTKIISVFSGNNKPQIKFMGTLKADYSENILKNNKSTIPMQYNDGETLQFTAYAGNTLTISTLIPTQSQTMNFVFSSCSDIDGNNYATVVIGTQTWMAENLKTTCLNNGTAIPIHTYNATWGALTTPAYAWYMNDTINKHIYGALYNWHAVNTSNLCPSGWHVPDNSEWASLSSFLGGDMVSGGKLKETGFSHWMSPNAGATNEVGFTALPGGSRNINGASIGVGISACWFTATEFDTDEANFCGCMHDFEMFFIGPGYKSCGNYIRCVKN